jgi:hypothetical protein
MNEPSLQLHQLERSARYRVLRAFQDYYRNAFGEGEILTFVERHFLPYHGGHTLIFKERTLYLQEDENAELINSFGLYLQRVSVAPAGER